MAERIVIITVLAECECQPGVPMGGAGMPCYFEEGQSGVAAMRFAELVRGKKTPLVHLGGRHVISAKVDGAYYKV